MALQPLWALASFSVSWSVHSRYDSLDGGSALCKAAAYTQGNTNTEKRKQTSMPLVGYEPTIPVFEWAKTVHALDRATTMIGNYVMWVWYNGNLG
jgi:hypothetical protein